MKSESVEKPQPTKEVSDEAPKSRKEAEDEKKVRDFRDVGCRDERGCK